MEAGAREDLETTTPRDSVTNNVAIAEQLKLKMHLTGNVSRITLGGAIIDIGLDKPGFVHLTRLNSERVNRVEDVVQVGQTVDVWVRSADPKKNHVELTMIEPLALEWREIMKGMVVKGKVTRIEKFGVFVEIGTERAGLIHISELTHDYIRTPNEVVKVDDEVEVKVIGVNRRKKQIRLSIKALYDKSNPLAQSAQQETTQEEENDVPVLTSMEIALREAIVKANIEDVEPTEPAPKVSVREGDEIDNILSRTLENYLPTE